MAAEIPGRYDPLGVVAVPAEAVGAVPKQWREVHVIVVFVVSWRHSAVGHVPWDTVL